MSERGTSSTARRVLPVLGGLAALLLVALAVAIVMLRDGAGSGAAERGGAAADDEPVATDAAPRRRVTQAPAAAEGAAVAVDEPATPSEQDAPAAAEPPPNLVVSVRTSDDRPAAGVTVLLRGTDLDGDVWSHDDAETDAEGLARFVTDGPSGAVLHACARLPFEPTCRAPVTFPTDPEHPVRLVLPPTCTVSCDVVDGAGELVESATAYLRTGDRIDEPPPRVEWELDEDVGTDVAKVFWGYAEFGLAPPDAALLVVVPARDDSERSAYVPFRSGAAGTTTHVRVVLGAPPVLVTGRLVDEQGAPLEGVTVLADMIQQGGPLWHSTHDGAADSDGAGRFRIPLDTDPSRAAGRTLRIARRTDPGITWRAQELLVRRLDDGFPGGALDVGDIVTTPYVLLAEGVVVDEDGAPVRGATVGAVVVRPGQVGQRVDVPAVETDETGAFALHGPPIGDFVDLGVAAGGRCLRERPHVAAGTRGLRVVAVPAGSLKGRLLLPDGVSARDLGLRVFAQGSALEDGSLAYVTARDGRRADVDEDGSFDFGLLAEGALTVSVRTGYQPDSEIASVPDVHVTPGAPSSDPRLDPLDLGACVNVRTVTLRTPEGEPVVDGVVHFRSAGGDGVWSGVEPASTGVAIVLARDAALDVVAVARGRRSATTRLTTGDATLTLAAVPPTTVSVHVSDDGGFPAAPWFLMLELQRVGAAGSHATESPDEHDPRNIEPWDVEFDAQHTARIEVWDPGRYRVVTYLMRQDVDGMSGTDVETRGAPPVFEVDGSGHPVGVEIAFDPADLESATRDE